MVDDSGRRLVVMVGVVDQDGAVAHE